MFITKPPDPRPKDPLRAGGVRPDLRPTTSTPLRSTPSGPSWWGCATSTRRPSSKAVARTGAPGFRSLEAMLANTDADVVITGDAERSPCRPGRAGGRGGAARDDREADGHPLAGRQADGPRLRRAPGVHLFVVKQNRRNATLQLVKRAVEKQRFGRIYMVNINVFWSRPQSYYDSAPVAGHLGIRRRRVHEPGEPLRGPARLAHRSGGERSGLHRDSRAQHPGRGHRRRQHSLAHRRARLDERDDAHLPQESRGVASPSSARRGRCASAEWRSTRSSTGSSPTPIRTMRRSSAPATTPRPSTASAIRSTTTT